MTDIFKEYLDPFSTIFWTGKPKMPEFYIELIDDEYWILPHDPPIGPYERKAEAVEGLAGIKRFYKANPLTKAEIDLSKILS
jgi:hypothetical protein